MQTTVSCWICWSVVFWQDDNSALEVRNAFFLTLRNPLNLTHSRLSISLQERPDWFAGAVSTHMHPLKNQRNRGPILPSLIYRCGNAGERWKWAACLDRNPPDHKQSNKTQAPIFATVTPPHSLAPVICRCQKSQTAKHWHSTVSSRRSPLPAPQLWILFFNFVHCISRRVPSFKVGAEVRWILPFLLWRSGMGR